MKLLEQSGDLVPPDPAKLIESLRGFGYSLQSALADLVDNSLTAGAKTVKVDVELMGAQPHLCVIDDGVGMDEARLVEAMRMGTIGPLTVRSAEDLGRFGLGLKSASLSQGRVLTVATCQGRKSPVFVRCWDLGHVARTGQWELLRTPGNVASSFVDQISEGGTAVVIEDLDRSILSSLTERRLADHFGAALQKVRDHLAMTFHRFVEEDGLTLCLGTSKLAAWDPFMREVSMPQPEESFGAQKSAVTVRPFLLPHHSKTHAESWERAAGPRGWNQHQGFWVYRCRRLIVPGSWLGLGFAKTDQTKLARVQVDLPNGVDMAWQLNVMKSRVAVPPPLRDDFRRIAQDVTGAAKQVYGYRGERAAPKPESPRQAIWRRRSSTASVSYSVDRAHPLVSAVLNGGFADRATIEKTLRVIERSLPIAAILQESVKSLDGAVVERDQQELNDLAELFTVTCRHFVRTGLAPEVAKERVLAVPPFCDVKEELLTAINANNEKPRRKPEL